MATTDKVPLQDLRTYGVSVSTLLLCLSPSDAQRVRDLLATRPSPEELNRLLEQLRQESAQAAVCIAGADRGTLITVDGACE